MIDQPNVKDDNRSPVDPSQRQLGACHQCGKLWLHAIECPLNLARDPELTIVIRVRTDAKGSGVGQLIESALRNDSSWRRHLLSSLEDALDSAEGLDPGTSRIIRAGLPEVRVEG